MTMGDGSSIADTDNPRRLRITVFLVPPIGGSARSLVATPKHSLNTGAASFLLLPFRACVKIIFDIVVCVVSLFRRGRASQSSGVGGGREQLLSSEVRPLRTPVTHPFSHVAAAESVGSLDRPK